jgi:hypothetical protein
LYPPKYHDFSLGRKKVCRGGGKEGGKEERKCRLNIISTIMLNRMK